MLAIAACDEDIAATKAPPTAADTGTDTGATTDAGGDGASTTLFQRVGGEAGITALIDAVIAAEILDPEIASYFAPNTLATPPAGKPTVAQIKECLVKQIGAAAGGPGIVYPTTVTGGFQCRTMEAAHGALHIGNGTFDKFATIAAGVAAKAGLTGADLQSLAGFLQLQKPLIVDPAAPDGGFYDSGIVIDSGTDAPADAPADG
jgi:hypothetical protein